MTVQFSSDIRLPSLIRQQLSGHAERLLERHHHNFGSMFLEIYLRPEGPQVACIASLVTDDGRYHAQVSGWDIRQVMLDALGRIDTQAHKRVEKRAYA
jgi:hypothetical protein